MNAPFVPGQLASRTSSKSLRKILLLAHASQAPYRVMRCAAALGAKVFIFATEESRSLAISRYCAGWHPFVFDPPPDGKQAVAEIEAFARANDIDMILPADAVATRVLASIRSRLETPVFPIPDLATFDALATKDRFMEFCREHGIRHPDGQILAGRDELLDAVANKRVRLPAILKPIDRWGSVGIVRIDESNAFEIAQTIDYSPILVQDFIEGLDRSISVFCRDGVVTKQVTYCYPDGAFTFTREPELARIVAGIARGLSLNGVYNFDARIEKNGDVWLLECNPRFFFTMDAAMVAGANFARIDDAPGERDFPTLMDDTEGAIITVPDGELRQPEALLKHVLRGHAPNRMDWRMLVHWLKDPLFFGLAVAGYKRRWTAKWLEQLLIARKLVR